MGKKAPKAPDPAQTAATQGAWNSLTAQQQQVMNQTNQISPWGSLEYTQSGQTFIPSSVGETYYYNPSTGEYRSSLPSSMASGASGANMSDPQKLYASLTGGNAAQTGSANNGDWQKVTGSLTPRFTATTKLSPQQQAIFDQTQAAELNLANIANQQSGRIGELLNNPFEFNNSDAEQWAYDLASPRILQQQQKNEGALRSQLIASGIRPGTAQWDSEMARLTNANTDQLNQLALTGRSQAFNEALAQRNQPLNEIIGLMSGTQIQNPNSTFAQTPQSQVAGVDYSGLAQNKYNADMQAYSAKTGALGGLFGGIASIFSDIRLKTDIAQVGETPAGQPVYSYRYVWGGPVQIGVMAHESPIEAVSVHDSGFLMVDYSKVK